MTAGRLVAAVAATAVGALLLLAITAPSVPWHDPAIGELRLSWRARPERIEICRKPSAEELAQLLEHMRQRLICEGSSASYALTVTVDDSIIEERVVRGGGLRHDRLIQLLQSHAIPSGSHRITVTFERREATPSDTATTDTAAAETGSGTFAGRAEREVTERQRGRQAAMPPNLELDTLLMVNPGTVILVTFDATARALQLVQRAQ